MLAPEPTNPKSGRRTSEEKAALVSRAEQLLAAGLTRAAAARELGISPATLRRWLTNDDSSLSGTVALVGKPKQQPEQDDEISDLQADLAAADRRYLRLLRTVEILAGAMVLMAIALAVWAPWNSQKRSAQTAANAYYSAQSNFMSCSKYAMDRELIACYRSYDSALSAISWPAPAQSTAGALHSDIATVIKQLSSGGDVTGAVTNETTDAQALSTTLLVLES